MNKIIRMISAIAAAVILLTGIVSCSEKKPADEAEVIAAAKELLSAAVEVNRIFFWEGLPHEEPKDNGIDLGDAEYLTLTEEYKYLYENDLIEKAQAVYTDDYCRDIWKIAFEGINIDDSEALLARYVMDSGVLKINRKLSEEGLPERIPSVETVKAVEIGHDTAVVSVDFTSETGVVNQNVTLKLEDYGWRLYTPTY